MGKVSGNENLKQKLLTPPYFHFPHDTKISTVTVRIQSEKVKPHQ